MMLKKRSSALSSTPSEKNGYRTALHPSKNGGTSCAASQIAEKKVIERVLSLTRWNRKEAAERLHISYKALLYKMKENGLSEGR